MIEQLVVEGLAIGACYGLFGIAVAIIYKTSEVVNFAQGEMGMVATFVAFHILTVYHVPFWLAFVLTLLFAAALGALIQTCFLRPAKDPTVLGLIIITLGAEMLLMGLAGWKWGAEQKDFPFILSVQKTREIAPGLELNEWSMGVFVLSAVIMLILFLFFRYSRLGIAMRATQQNVNAAKVMGIKVERVFAITWAMSSVIGAV
ncbi:MAG TPA: branched-chain amino acid ABC transporter permease, partial [Deltaproteobacteria bacterium]|nr:branched-chain amino acid ABC transporter permease [Deltaproteobacteria bacterium]